LLNAVDLNVDSLGRKVADLAREKLHLADARLRPEHDYASLPLCVIDAVFSIAANYELVTKPTVIRFANAQCPPWPLYGRRRSFEHSVSDATRVMGGFRPQTLAADVFKNRQRTSTRHGILKAEACLLFLGALSDFGIDRFSDLSSDKLTAAEIQIRKIPGQNISYDYFNLLAGAQTVKPDRMIIRFVGDAVGNPMITPSVAKAAVVSASQILSEEFGHLDVRLLDSEIWSYESQKAAQKRRRIKRK
jgi:hypothetical protein